MRSLRRFLADQSAATAVEYSLIVALVATVAIGAMTNVGHGIVFVLQTASNAMN